MSSVNWGGVAGVLGVIGVVGLATLLAGPIGFILGIVIVAGIGFPVQLHIDRLRQMSELEERVERLEAELEVSNAEDESTEESRP